MSEGSLLLNAEINAFRPTSESFLGRGGTNQGQLHLDGSTVPTMTTDGCVTVWLGMRDTIPVREGREGSTGVGPGWGGNSHPHPALVPMLSHV